jgi:chromosome segregation ATPase
MIPIDLDMSLQYDYENKDGKISSNVELDGEQPLNLTANLMKFKGIVDNLRDKERILQREQEELLLQENNLFKQKNKLKKDIEAIIKKRDIHVKLKTAYTDRIAKLQDEIDELPKPKS